MKVALYARVSTTDQDCAMQLSELRRYVEARGWEVCGEFIDHGYSGKNGKRPALQRCLTAAKSRHCDAVAVWKLDRWGRTVRQLVNDIADLDSADVRFISLQDGIDTDKKNPNSRLMMHIFAAFAEFERAIINERVNAGVRYAKEHGTRSGNPIGRPKRIFNRDQIREMRAAGKSYGEIQKATGVPVTTIRRACEGYTA